MKRALSYFALFFLVVCGVMFFSPNSASAKTKVKVKKVIIKSNFGKVVHVAKGKSVKVTAGITVKPNKPANRKLLFSINKKSIASVSGSGSIKGKKVGSAKVTVKAKKNKKKKASVSVKVVKPVKSIVVKSKQSYINIGESLELSKEITPKTGSYKGVVWSSSNPKIISVSSAGIIKGLSAGTATIKATSVEGSKRSGSVKIKVMAKGTVNLTSIKVISPKIIRATFDRVVSLKKSDFNIQSKSTYEGKYNIDNEIDRIINYDGFTYDIYINPNRKFECFDYVKLSVGALFGNGTKALETQYTIASSELGKSVRWSGLVGETLDKELDFSKYCNGKIKYEVKGLPEYLSYTQEGNKLFFEGEYKDVLDNFTFTVKGEGEQGRVFVETIKLCIGDKSHIVVDNSPLEFCKGYSLPNVSYAVNVDKIFAVGASKDYEFVATNMPAGLSVSENGFFVGTPTVQGKYEANVTVYDIEDDSIVTNTKISITVKDCTKLAGKITSKTDSLKDITVVIASDYYYIEIKVSENGEYDCNLPEGNYDIEIYAQMGEKNVFREYSDIAVGNAGRKFDVVFDEDDII